MAGAWSAGFYCECQSPTLLLAPKAASIVMSLAQVFCLLNGAGDAYLELLRIACHRQFFDVVQVFRQTPHAGTLLWSPAHAWHIPINRTTCHHLQPTLPLHQLLLLLLLLLIAGAASGCTHMKLQETALLLADTKWLAENHAM
jgi:hypothetical protein